MNIGRRKYRNLIFAKDMVPCCLFVALKADDKVIKMEILLKYAFSIKNRAL